MEGMIAKSKGSIYRPGKQTSEWVKITWWQVTKVHHFPANRRIVSQIDNM
jgi:hypothetical protein